jgi:hypothetical protein
MKTASVQYQEEQQRAKLVFDEDFPSSQNAELIIQFQGLINDVSITSFQHILRLTLIPNRRTWPDSRGQNTSPPPHQLPQSRITLTLSITTCSPPNSSLAMPVVHFLASMSRQ